MFEYYTVPWSLHCKKGEELLRQAGIRFSKTDFVDRSRFAALPRDLGIHRLPVLTGDGVFCEGLDQIVEFVSKEGKR